MPDTRHILLFGHDSQLLESRAMLLAALGKVTACRDLATLGACSATDCDLIVLCHTLTADELMQASSLIADGNLQTEVLAMTLGRSSSQEAAWSHIVDAFEGSRAFLAKVEALLQSR